MTHRHSLLFVIAFIGAAITAIMSAIFLTNLIESSSVSQIQQEMQISGYEWVTIEADGLQVVLSGESATVQDEIKVQQVASNVVGPDRIINLIQAQSQVQELAPEFSLKILRNSTSITVIGLVPANWDSSRFYRTLNSTPNLSKKAANLTQTSDYATPDYWASAAIFGAEASQKLEKSEVSIYQKNVDIAAVIENESTKINKRRILNRLMPENVNISFDLKTPRPLISPFVAKVSAKDGTTKLEFCSASNLDEKNAIFETAKQMNIEVTSCPIGQGAPSQMWKIALISGMQIIKNIENGHITYSDNTIEVVTDSSYPIAALERLEAQFSEMLPIGFSLSVSKDNANPLQSSLQDKNTQFIALRTPDGQIELRGQLPDQRVETALSALTQSAFINATINENFEISSNTPEKWTSLVIASVETLSYLEKGSVTTTPTSIRIRGESYDPNTNGAILNNIRNLMGREYGIDMEIDFIEYIEPETASLNAQTCIKTASAILEKNKIKFSPGSTIISPEMSPILDELATVFETCRPIRVEVGAFSDSQGPEDMNLRLSQARANSVVQSLVSRQVLSVDFVAKGYGEANPIDDNETEAGRENNRRIEFKHLIDTESTSNE